MANPTQYKIRLKGGRVLGPIELERIRELLEAGQIRGNEQTSKLPSGEWKKLSAHPELGKLLLEILSAAPKKTTADTNEGEIKKSEEVKLPTPAEPSQPNLTNVTRRAPLTDPSFRNPEVPQKKSPPPKPKDENLYGDVPTLVNIKPLENPDLERTKITQVSAKENHRENISQYVADATKVIDTRRDLQLQPEKGEKIPIAKFLGVEVKRRLISKQVIYIVVTCLFISLFMMKQEEKVKDEVNELRPKMFRFKPVQVNSPGITKDKKINVGASLTMLDRAVPYFELDSPIGYIKAAGFLYKAVFHNPENIVARSMLASSYIRLAEVIPRNERFFKTVSELLDLGTGGKEKKAKPVEYYLALSEFDLLLERPERALQTIEVVAKRSPLPSLLYQQAVLYRMQGERNKAISIITRALKMTDETTRSPRHLLLYAQLLEEKDQRGAALKVIKSFLKKNPNHGLGLYTYARILYKNNDFNRAMKTLMALINKPQRADSVTLAQAFILTARIFEAKNRLDKANLFAEAAKFLLPENPEPDDLIFRIRSRLPSTKKLYSLLLEAKEKERSKEFNEAITLYIRARESDRTSPVPLFHLAKLYERIGKPHMAIDLYKIITQMEKKVIDAYFSLATLYLKQYETDNAIAMVKAVRGRMRKSSRVTHMLGRIALTRGDPAQARAQFIAAIEAGSKIPQLYVDMAAMEAENKDSDMAEFYYSVALRYDPFNEEALYGIALSRFIKTTPTDAVKFLETKLFARPNSPQVLTNLALIHLRSGNKDLGKQYLQRAVRSDPMYARAYKLMGNLVREEGDRQSDFEEKRRSYKFALASYGAYSKLAPFDPEGYMLAADLYRSVRDLGAAAKNYHKVISLAPNYPMVRVYLAQIALNGQDFEMAKKQLEEEIKRHPNSSDAYLELGRMHLLQKEYPLATQALITSAKLNTKNVTAITLLGLAHYMRNDFNSAIALYERALEINPLNEELHWRIGLAYEKDGKKGKALAAYRNFQGLVTDPRRLLDVQRRIADLQAGR